MSNLLTPIHVHEAGRRHGANSPTLRRPFTPKFAELPFSAETIFAVLGVDPVDPRCPRCNWPLEWAEAPAFPGDPAVGISIRCKRNDCVLGNWDWAKWFTADALRVSLGETRRRLLTAVRSIVDAQASAPPRLEGIGRPQPADHSPDRRACAWPYTIREARAIVRAFMDV
ncbi:MAG: hypothetical protein ACREX3_05685 [Gammaproteobacteria bacterium]